MSEARVLSDAPWLRSGPAARVLALLNGDGEEARVVGGAVRNALLKIPLGDIDIATTALPDEVIRRAKAAGIKMRADRHRPRHRHAGGRMRIRSRSRPCARTPRPSAARPRSRSAATGFAMRNGATSPSTGFPSMPTASCTTMSAGLPISKPDACASSAMPASASPRIICASCASSACMPPTGRASPIAPDISPASPGARDLPAFPPNACAWKC